ncbi:hypothetical protein CCAL12920_00780 [Campylobacter sp. RM12920]|uniref:Transcriptional repressor NrdR-like N-terminal domain-containing protein n=1 Tax=Campylobacter californiensis TaxID=1032243 RepID=A0ABD4JGW2_9BACT|nr:hypothetical protein [Campylobacter sp. RM12919]MBE2987435.1 hypothetical protein [Campylobacter sp. RM12920]
MFCPYCGYEKTKVVGTVKGLETIRFRKCPECENTWTTAEAVRPNDEYLENFIKIRDEYKNRRFSTN